MLPNKLTQNIINILKYEFVFLVNKIKLNKVSKKPRKNCIKNEILK